MKKPCSIMQATEVPRAGWRFLMVAGSLVFFAYLGLPFALWLCRVAGPLDGIAAGLGTVAVATAGVAFAYVAAGAPVAMRLLARDLQRFQAEPLVRLESLFARVHFWLWLTAIAVAPFYIAYLALP